ncbi:IclR family transcriptional regulator [Ktedonospora formicarum]|uniref:IclR family transcriptional regulator n=1 Tax=Ktedonospora formicarum TaxID=2778364 RepID=A0A8J3I5S2_9CHLR|nr:IclR family transcriptional regulator [Ktedonospora formicarum]GHO47911.1 IclR family transcriptional regulator [Ktedonospora formicarum]
MKPHVMEKVGSLLNLFTFEQPEWGVREAAEALDLPRSTMGDLLLSLAQQGLLNRTPAGRYQLGWRLFELSHVLIEHTAFCIEARIEMRELVERWGETAHLAVLDGTQVLFVEKLQATPAVEILLSRVGARLSAHEVGVGKVLLAFQAPYRLPALLDRLTLAPRTPRTITSRDHLLQELEQVRQQGYAYDHEETSTGLCCVAAPILDEDGQVPAAISLCIPAYRYYRQQEHYTEVIVKAAQAISERLGYHGRQADAHREQGA